MIIMLVQSDKYNPKGLLKKSHSVSPALICVLKINGGLTSLELPEGE